MNKITKQNYLHSIKHTNTFKALISRVLSAGSDHIPTFSGNLEGGYRIQQKPNELAALCHYLREIYPIDDFCPIDNFIEIGSASGGTLRFIYENVGFTRGIVIDDFQHPASEYQDDNFFGFRHKLSVCYCNSHSEKASSFLTADINHSERYVVFIDGDHSEQGVVQDIEMIKRFGHDDVTYIFHDICIYPGVLTAINRTGLDIETVIVDDDSPIGIAIGSESLFTDIGRLYR